MGDSLLLLLRRGVLSLVLLQLLLAEGAAPMLRGAAPMAPCPARASTAAAARAARVGMQMYDSATYNAEKAGLGAAPGTDSRPDGAHGTGFRFMPLETMSKEPAPALLCIAGAYPGLTADQLLAPTPLPFAPRGQWNYHVLSGASSNFGFVALPGTTLLERAPNTVAVVCSSGSLGVEFPDNSEREVLALIDRDDAAVDDPFAFDDRDFYAFADESGLVHIRWADAVPAGWRVLGRLIYSQMPMVKTGSSGGFAEMSDDFEF